MTVAVVVAVVVAVAVTSVAVIGATLAGAWARATLPEAWPVPVAVSWGCGLVHLLMGGYRQLGHQHNELLEAQLLVLVCVQVLHDLVDSFVILLLLLQVGDMGRQGWVWPGLGTGRSTASDLMAEAQGHWASGPQLQHLLATV